MARRLESWIESYLDFTKGIKSPARYRRWAAISAVAAALQRRVKVRIEGQYQFANLYTLLVGPPGLGKGNAIKPMQRIVRKLGTIRLTPRGLTKRAFYTVMEEARSTDIDTTNNIQNTHSSVTAIIEEFGVFLTPKDIEFMDALADVYDNPETWTYKTQHSGENNVENPSFNMVAATTPKGVRERFTDDIFEMGLPARITMIYADDKIVVPLFTERPQLPALELDLVHDLEQITQLQGEFSWSPDASAELEIWVKDGMKPIPLDSRFQHYCARRLAHLTKLCMICSASKKDDLRITGADLSEAKATLLEAESVMPGAVSAVGGNPLKEQILAAWKYVELTYKRTGKAVPEHMLLRFLYNEVPVQYVDSVITALTHTLRMTYTGEAPYRKFRPVEGGAHGQFEKSDEDGD